MRIFLFYLISVWIHFQRRKKWKVISHSKLVENLVKPFQPGIYRRPIEHSFCILSLSLYLLSDSTVSLCLFYLPALWSLWLCLSSLSLSVCSLPPLVCSLSICLLYLYLCALSLYVCSFYTYLLSLSLSVWSFFTCLLYLYLSALSLFVWSVSLYLSALSLYLSSHFLFTFFSFSLSVC